MSEVCAREHAKVTEDQEITGSERAVVHRERGRSPSPELLTGDESRA